MNKNDAIIEIQRMMRDYDVSVKDLGKVQKSTSGSLQKLFYYIGAILVFAGLALFVGMFWKTFGITFQVLSTLGVGFVLFAMAIIAINDERYTALSTPLILMSSLLEATGLMVLLRHISDDPDPAKGGAIISAFMLLQHFPIFLKYRRSVLIFTMLFFFGLLLGCLTKIAGLLPKFDAEIGFAIGISYIFILTAISKTRHRAVTGFWFLVASIGSLCSLWMIVKDTIGGLLFLGFSAFFIYLATYVSSRSLLFVGSASMLFYIGKFTNDHFASTMGWPIALLMIGVSFFALGRMAIKLTKNMDYNVTPLCT